MTDPYADIGVPEAVDPYAGVGVPAGPPRKSQTLGLARGMMRPLDNASLAVESGLKKLGIPVDEWAHNAGMPSAADAVQGRKDAVAGYRAQGIVPGGIGEAVGGGVGSLPFLMATGITGPLTGGALSGALTSDHRDLQGVAGDMALGAVGGKIGDSIVGAVGRNIEQATRPAVKMLRDAGVKLTPGQIFGGKAAIREDKAMSRPILGDKITDDRIGSLHDWNLGFINENLKQIGGRLPEGIKAGHEAVAYGQQAVHDAFEAVVPKLAVQADQPFLDGVSNAIKGAVMTPKARSTALNLITKQMFPPGTAYTGKALQQVRRTAQGLAQKYKVSTQAEDGPVGDLLSEIADHLDDLIVRQNPTHAAQFEAANTAHRGQMIIDRAAKGTDDGVFTTGGAKQAALAMDPSKRKAASARGEAFMQPLIKAARDVLPSKTPNSYSADRLMAGKLIPMITGAGARVGYGVQGALADFAADLSPKAVEIIRRSQKPAGLFGGMAPGGARARDGR